MPCKIVYKAYQGSDPNFPGREFEDARPPAGQNQWGGGGKLTPPGGKFEGEEIRKGEIRKCNHPEKPVLLRLIRFFVHPGRQEGGRRMHRGSSPAAPESGGGVGKVKSPWGGNPKEGIRRGNSDRSPGI